MNVSPLSKVCDALASQTSNERVREPNVASFESHLCQADCANVILDSTKTLPDSSVWDVSSYLINNTAPKANPKRPDVSSLEDIDKPMPIEKASNFDSAFEFVQTIKPFAIRASQALGIPAKLLIAQAALETGWGRAMIRDESGQLSFNLFNIKAKANSDEPSMRVLTHEYEKEQWQLQQAAFKVYDSFYDCFMDYGSLLQQPRYKEALEHSHDPEAFVTQLQKAGFATDPDYAEKVLAIYQSERLGNDV